MNRFRLGFFVGAAILAGYCAPASAVPYTSHADTTGVYASVDDLAIIDLGGGTVVQLGWDGYPNLDGNGHGFDQLTIFPVSGSITADGIYLLNTFDFDAELNRSSGAGPFHYTFTQDLEIGGVTHAIEIPFTISISSSDTLFFEMSDPPFDLVVFTLDIESMPLGPIVNGGGHVTGSIYAKVTGVPEPSALLTVAMAAACSLGFAFMLRRVR